MNVSLLQFLVRQEKILIIGNEAKTHQFKDEVKNFDSGLISLASGFPKLGLE